MLIPVRVRLVATGMLMLLAAGCEKKKDDTPDPVTPPVTTPTYPATQVQAWVTHSNKSALFSRQRVALNFAMPTSNSYETITVDTTQTFQTIDGFGFSLTEGSAYVLNRMAASNRAALLRELFATDSTFAGFSYLRLSIGASDLNSRLYTYDDVPGDVNLTNFDLGFDKADVIPVLKEILAINPSLKLMGSPWTAPIWMKTNNSYKGGRLKPENYAPYAQYFVKYIQAMQNEGIRIDAVTLQNEPLNEYNEPSMLMSAAEQADFIKNHVGPAFAAAGLTTKIVAYDHNCDVPSYPIDVLSDPGAYPYVDGSAFHLYGGDISAMTQVHNAFPDKNVYFTEQWTGAPGNFGNDVPEAVRKLVIGGTRNWARNVLQWNLAADQNNDPHTPGGCASCLPAVTVNGNSVTRNPAYYAIIHASKFVRPGAVRVATAQSNNLNNVAFRRPDGKKVLLVLNTSNALQNFNISFRGKVVTTSLYAGSAGTYVW
jgi:glucosylceramidase